MKNAKRGEIARYTSVLNIDISGATILPDKPPTHPLYKAIMAFTGNGAVAILEQEVPPVATSSRSRPNYQEYNQQRQCEPRRVPHWLGLRDGDVCPFSARCRALSCTRAL